MLCFKVKKFGLYFYLSFILFFSSEVLAEIKENNADKNVPQKIHANYHVKASFFALPITAKITVAKIEPQIYQANIKLSSPFFKVDQKETAKIHECKIQLLEISSKGSRLGAIDCDEKISLSWPDKRVSYRDGENKPHHYVAPFEPTGFTSLFAHQFISLAQNDVIASKQKALTYTQSSRGWRMDYVNVGLDKGVKNRFFDNEVQATRFIVTREDLSQEDAPSIWYKPEKLGALPLKMTMKLGVFRV